MFDFSNYSIKSKYCNDSNRLAIGKMKDEIWVVMTEEFAGLKPKIYSFLVDENSEDNSKAFLSSYKNLFFFFFLVRTAFVAKL